MSKIDINYVGDSQRIGWEINDVATNCHVTDGIDDYGVLIQNEEVIKVWWDRINPNVDFTVSFWIKPREWNWLNKIYVAQSGRIDVDGVSTLPYWALYIADWFFITIGTDGIGLELNHKPVAGLSPIEYRAVYGGYEVEKNEWYHCTYVHDAKDMSKSTVYLNSITHSKTILDEYSTPITNTTYPVWGDLLASYKDTDNTIQHEHAEIKDFMLLSQYKITDMENRMLYHARCNPNYYPSSLVSALKKNIWYPCNQNNPSPTLTDVSLGWDLKLVNTNLNTTSGFKQWVI